MNKSLTRAGSSKISKSITSGLVILGLMVSGSASADQVIFAKKKTAKKKSSSAEKKKYFDCGDGWEMSTQGGLSYIHPTDDRYWFKLSGTLRLDETLFMGNARDKGNSFPSGGSVRRAETFIDAGIGKHWEFTMGLNYNGTSVAFGDTYVSYDGLMKNNQVYIGRISGNWFGLDNSNSTSWNPFLERSLQANAFYPGDGLGVGTDFWWDHGGFTLMAFQPDQNANDNSLATAGTKDRWRGTVRLTVAPLHKEGNVWHFGVSGAFRDVMSDYAGVNPTSISSNRGVRFNVRPSARSRNTATLVDTMTGNGGTNIRANNVRLFNVELARQYGPFMLEGEYTNAYVHRVQDTNNRGVLRFSGWNLQTRYMLTGEAHSYDVRNGQFGSFKPKSKYGAWELAARYDAVNLNDKDVQGGSEHNVTLGVNWFINQQVRLSANYIRAKIHPANQAQVRKLDIIGMRAQVRFK